MGIILLFFIGRAFYQLAEKNDKSKWVIGGLGIAIYYAGQLIGGFIIGIVAEIISPGWVLNQPDLVLGFMALPFGILTCAGSYYMLKSSWEKTSARKRLPDDVLDKDF